jgi:hypothetical protein
VRDFPASRSNLKALPSSAGLRCSHTVRYFWLSLGGEIYIGAAAVVIKEVQGCLHAMHALAPAVLLSPVGYGDQALTAGVDECVLFPFVTPSTIAYGNERTMNALPYTLRGISMQYHKM